MSLYKDHLPTILQLLFPSAACDDREGEEPANQDTVKEGSWANRHEFLSVSITPLECSIVCEHALGISLFGSTCEKIVKIGGSDQRNFGSISTETFVAISVEGSGMEVGVLQPRLPLPVQMLSCKSRENLLPSLFAR